MKILSWNVNGVRSVGRNGFFDWLDREMPDIVCLQETKCNPAQLDPSYLAPLGYQTYWHSAKKAGYSGVAIYSRVAAKDVKEGIGIPAVDDEGRVLAAHFKEFTLVNAYFPNSQRDHARLGYKLEFCDAIFKFCEKLRKEGRFVILCGDYNIAHKEIDLRNPKTNVNNAGFLPEERAWMDRFVGAGWIDTFRRFVSEPNHYSWWSYRPGVREKNIGWRIDYHCVNAEFIKAVKEASILPQVFGSDHCPVGIRLG
ncbi:MAG: exodeoxyribonuclease III [Bdellovibrionota bacterium]